MKNMKTKAILFLGCAAVVTACAGCIFGALVFEEFLFFS
jgi:hypothetical protein